MSGRTRIALAAVVAALSLAVAAAPASAAVSKCQARNVTLGSKESPDLQGLIDAAGAGDTIQIKGICVGNYTIPKSLTVFGKPTKEVPEPTLDGNAAGKVVAIDGAHTVAISDLTIRNGKAQFGAGIHTRIASLSLTDVVVRNNVGVGVPGDTRSFGGGIFNQGTLTIGGSSVVRDNSASSGGGLYSTGGSSTLNDSTSITHNTGLSLGGGVANFGGVLTLNDSSSVTHNSTDNSTPLPGEGGGIYNGFGQVVLNDQSSVHGNSGRTVGGIYIICSIATVTGAQIGVNVYNNSPTDITTCP